MAFECPECGHGLYVTQEGGIRRCAEGSYRSSLPSGKLGPIEWRVGGCSLQWTPEDDRLYLREPSLPLGRYTGKVTRIWDLHAEWVFLEARAKAKAKAKAKVFRLSKATYRHLRAEGLSPIVGANLRVVTAPGTDEVVGLTCLP